jgi:outer membrane protein TolC
MLHIGNTHPAQRFLPCCLFLLSIFLLLPVHTFAGRDLTNNSPHSSLHPQDISTAGADISPQNKKQFSAEKKDSEKNAASFATADTEVEQPEIIAVYYDLFQLAYRTAPDVRIARARKKQKSAQRYTAWAKRLAPAVNARFSQVHEFNMDSDPLSTGDVQENQPYNYTDGEDYQDWGFTLDLPVYRRPVSIRIDIAVAEEKLAENNLIIKTQELDLRLRELLGNYLIASYRLLNLRNSVRLSTEHVNKIYKGYELRDQTRLQLLRAQANLKELEARRDLDEQRREVALRELLDFTGLKAENPVFHRLNKMLIDEISTAGCINSLANLQQNFVRIKEFVDSADDGDLRHYFFEHSLLCTNVNLERDLARNKALTHTENEWPGLSVRGLYDRRDDTQFSKFNGEGSLALVFSVPLFSGGTIISNSKTRTMAQHIADVTQYADLRKTIHAMENNRHLIVSLQKVYTTQQIHLRQQQEIVVLSLKSYTIKQTSMQDLLTSQNRLIDAKNALMETINTLGSLYRQFAWQLGTPYSIPSINVPIEE